MKEKAPWRECGTCHRMFAGNECYANRCRPNKEGQSVCQRFYKCTKCQKVIAYKKRRPDAHKCGEIMCLNCEDYVDPNTHLRYMKPIKFEDDEQGKKNKEKKRQTKEKEDVCQKKWSVIKLRKTVN